MTREGGCDVVLVGVGGQGILTIGEILLRAALESGVAASFAPTKGMAQRGGFVKAELRLGRDGIGRGGVGPRIGDAAANLVLATERSEALRGIQYVSRDGAVVLYDEVWAPTGVMLSTARYPERDVVVAAIEAAGAQPILLVPSELPLVDGRPAAGNLVVLGAACAVSALAGVLDAGCVEKTIAARWPKAAPSNTEAFRMGFSKARLGSSRELQAPASNVECFRIGFEKVGKLRPGTSRGGLE